MSFKLCLSVSTAAVIAAMVIGCAPEGTGSSPQDVERAIQALASQVPKKTDAATTLVEVRSDGQGGVIYVSSVDTSMVSVPSTENLKRMLCEVRSDSPPAGNRNTFSGITYIYRDLQGKELANLHFGRGECPGQAL
jgi:hypothetical protein